MPQSDRFKFVDDLTILEVIYLINIEMASHHMKQPILNYIPVNGQTIPTAHLKSQKFIKDMNQWTTKHEMTMSVSKSESIIINLTNEY